MFVCAFSYHEGWMNVSLEVLRSWRSIPEFYWDFYCKSFCFSRLVSTAWETNLLSLCAEMMKDSCLKFLKKSQRAETQQPKIVSVWFKWAKCKNPDSRGDKDVRWAALNPCVASSLFSVAGILVFQCPFM